MTGTERSHANTPTMGPVVGHISVPEEAIVASGVGRETTQWHRYELQQQEAAASERGAETEMP